MLSLVIHVGYECSDIADEIHFFAMIDTFFFTHLQHCPAILYMTQKSWLYYHYDNCCTWGGGGGVNIWPMRLLYQFWKKLR